MKRYIAAFLIMAGAVSGTVTTTGNTATYNCNGSVAQFGLGIRDVARLRILERIDGEMELAQERLYNLKLKDPGKPKAGIEQTLPASPPSGVLFETVSDMLPYIKEEYRPRQYKSTNIMHQEKPNATEKKIEKSKTRSNLFC